MMEAMLNKFRFENIMEYCFHRLVLSSKTEVNLFQPILALLMLLFLSPLFLLISILIFIQDGDLPFYTQSRVGKEGKIFSVIKFRSMKTNAEESTGPVLSCVGDTRVTFLGRILRSLHLDELPQLINVLKGDMNFIGPRPERPCFTKRFEIEIPKYSKRYRVRPGITGLSQVMLPYDAIAKEKIDFDLFYIKYRESIILNFVICLLTLLKMIQIPFFSHSMNRFIKEAANG